MPKKTDTERFVETALGTSGRLQSVVVLLDRALLCLNEAKTVKNTRNANIVKVQNILAQLQMALNFREGELAGRLFFLDFFFDELNHRDDRSVETCLRLMADLRDSLNSARKRKGRA